MVKNIFLDRDGIINEVVIRNSKPASPRNLSEFKIKKEFDDFYRVIYKYNFNLFVVSNQPDIARNLIQLSELNLMSEQLKNRYDFVEINYCTHDENDGCSCRKPKPGMILNIIKKYGLNKNDCLIIGDSWKDIEAGNNAGIMTVFLVQEYNVNINVRPNYKINKLGELFELNILG